MQQLALSKSRARRMRKDMTAAERALWDALRNRRFMGLKIRRQVPVGPFIADFYCADHRLVIEDDGCGHGAQRDLDRDHWLGKKGFRILRLRNGDAIAARTPAH